MRFFDILLSGFAICALSPFFLIIIIILLMTGEHKVFYFQDRVGKEGKIFRLFKFTTMMSNSMNMGTGPITVKDDPRILPFGFFLRKTKINELPQLLNVLVGHMSIVGPRPQTPRCFSVFPIESQNIITQVRPGLSGIGSIIFRSEEDILQGFGQIEFYDNVIAPYKGLCESWYVSNYSLRNYFLLIFITVWTIFFPRTQIMWRLKDLPIPPKELIDLLNYPYIFFLK